MKTNSHQLRRKRDKRRTFLIGKKWKGKKTKQRIKWNEREREKANGGVWEEKRQDQKRKQSL